MHGHPFKEYMRISWIMTSNDAICSTKTGKRDNRLAQYRTPSWPSGRWTVLRLQAVSDRHELSDLRLPAISYHCNVPSPCAVQPRHARAHLDIWASMCDLANTLIGGNAYFCLMYPPCRFINILAASAFFSPIAFVFVSFHRLLFVCRWCSRLDCK